MQISNRLSVISQAAAATLPAVAAFSVLIASGAPALAVTQTYDSNTTPPINDGAGPWNTTTANWVDGGVYSTWNNTLADVAVFGSGGAGGAVAVGTVNAGTIQFGTLTAGYTLGGGTITLGTGITSTSTVTNVINSVIAGTNGLAFTGAGSTTVSLGGANTYTGITAAGATGRLQITNAAGFGSSAGATATTLGGNQTTVATGGTLVAGAPTGATITEAFVLNGSGTAFAGALRINNTPTFSSLVQLGSSASILNNGGLAATFDGNIALGAFRVTLGTNGALVANTTIYNGDITGTGGVNVEGGVSGHTFNGVKTYTGTTSVTGTLNATGSLASSAVTVGTAGTLNAGTNGTVGALALAGTTGATINGRYVADLTAATSDLLAITGALNLASATDVLTIQGVSGAPLYTLATFSSLTGTFDTVSGVPAGYQLNYNPTSITLTPVPEPTALAALGLGGLLAMRRRRA